MTISRQGGEGLPLPFGLEVESDAALHRVDVDGLKRFQAAAGAVERENEENFQTLPSRQGAVRHSGRRRAWLAR